MRIQMALLCLAMCCVATGCGPSRPKTVPVSGRVTWQGKSVTTGRITFYPTAGRPASAAIGADGVYHLTTFESDDGAVLGKHRVTIEVRRSSRPARRKTFEQEAREGFPDEREQKVEWLVPEKYSQRDTTPSTAEVTAETKTIDFSLP